MKVKIPAIIAALFSCAACVDVDYTLGSNLLPAEQDYDTYVIECPVEDITLQMADSLSGYSQRDLVIGGIRDAEGRYSGRSAAITIVPMNKEMNFGTDPEFRRFHLSLIPDSISVANLSEAHILQSVNVRELIKTPDAKKDYDCNGTVKYGGKVCKGAPLVSGKDSLSLDFTKEYASKFFSLTEEDLKDWSKYSGKIPGLYFDIDKPGSEGGRINFFSIQLQYNEDNGLTGNFAELSFTSEYDGERKDTSFFFMLGLQKMMDVDSLITNTVSGVNYPQYCLNLTDEKDFRKDEGKKAGEFINVGGGGGLKPVIKASYLRDLVAADIREKGGDPKMALINKATLRFPFELTANPDNMFRYPMVLSPTTRISSEGTVSFAGLTDASNETESVGNINRACKWYAPDFSYHMQTILNLEDKDLEKGSYDIWMLLMAYNTVVTDSSNKEMAELYEQLAYQSYYSQMYGGGYGYGYGGDSYSNYYSYMMMAQYASSNTSSSITLDLDKDRYYSAKLHGPLCPDPSKKPSLLIIYSIPKKKTE